MLPSTEELPGTDYFFPENGRCRAALALSEKSKLWSGLLAPRQELGA